MVSPGRNPAFSACEADATAAHLNDPYADEGIEQVTEFLLFAGDQLAVDALAPSSWDAAEGDEKRLAGLAGFSVAALDVVVDPGRGDEIVLQRIFEARIVLGEQGCSEGEEQGGG